MAKSENCAEQQAKDKLPTPEGTLSVPMPVDQLCVGCEPCKQKVPIPEGELTVPNSTVDHDAPTAQLDVKDADCKPSGQNSGVSNLSLLKQKFASSSSKHSSSSHWAQSSWRGDFTEHVSYL